MARGRVAMVGIYAATPPPSTTLALIQSLRGSCPPQIANPGDLSARKCAVFFAPPGIRETDVILEAHDPAVKREPAALLADGSVVTSSAALMAATEARVSTHPYDPALRSGQTARYEHWLVSTNYESYAWHAHLASQLRVPDDLRQRIAERNPWGMAFERLWLAGGWEEWCLTLLFPFCTLLSLSGVVFLLLQSRAEPEWKSWRRGHPVPPARSPETKELSD